MSERKRTRQRNEAQVLDLLRRRVLSGIHSGHLNAGDRAPTYREVADETGLDLRAVARIYDALERKGLLEVRGRQGVFIAQQERLGGRVLEETMEAIRRKRWAIAEGYIPEGSHGPEPEMTSHDTACILNASDGDAEVRITVFFSDREPAGPYRVTIPAR